MRFDIINIVIACGISVLLAFACYSICDIEELRMLLTIVSFVMFLLFAVPSLGIKVEAYPRTSIFLKVTSITFWSIGVIANFVFSFFDFNKSAFIITNGVLLLVFILIYSSLYKVKQ